MPKITAGTVAEHREMQRATLVRLAEEILTEDGYDSLTFGVLAERADLSRPSVYSYFKSKDDILLAVCEAVLPRFFRRIDRAMALARSPQAQLVAFVRAQLQAAADGEHVIAQAVDRVPLSSETLARIGELHERFAPNIVAVIAMLGHRHPELIGQLVQGVVNAGVARIDAGEPARRVIRAATDLVLKGVGETSS
jgi:AcrR family transcriptional regulator